MKAQVQVSAADSFRTQFLETFQYCEHMEVGDTIQFLKQGLYSMDNFDFTASFNQLFFCFENGYMNFPDPDRRKYPVEELYRVRDVRWIFLFYLDRYILPTKNQIPINKFCKISLHKIRKNEEVEMWDEGSMDNIILIYKKLIRIVNRKGFTLQKLSLHKRSLLEEAGYYFKIEKVKALW
ncbi:MAG TPA: hypothetical protein PLU10_02510 [Chitinophagaceae bacterium]|nr:hypothetical protein [Chitinophagaceae bacterium]